MDLFEYARQKNMDQEAPLASRLRPTTLEEVVGQQHIIGKDKLLYRAIKADKLSSIIFYGPPGTGKTTLAKVIAIRQCRIHPDQCNGGGQERYGRSGTESERDAGHVSEEDHSFCR